MKTIIYRLLVVYFNTEKIKDFALRMSVNKKAPVIHQFHPEVLLRASVQEQHKQQTPSYEQAHDRFLKNVNLEHVNQLEKTSPNISTHI